MPIDDDHPLPEALGYRLEQLEKGLRHLEQRIEERFDRMGGEVRSLAFVPVAVYQSEREAMRDMIKETREIASNARAVAMWALGLVAATVISAVIGLAAKAAG